MSHPTRRLGVLAAALLLVALSLPLAARADKNELGAYIYEGTCDKLGDRPVDDIGDLEIDDLVKESAVLGTPVPSSAFYEDEDIDLTIDDLTGSPHVVVIRASDSTSADVIGCAEITGKADADGVLSVDIKPVEGGKYEGTVWFKPSKDNDEPTTVITVLWSVGEGIGTATPTT